MSSSSESKNTDNSDKSITANGSSIRDKVVHNYVDRSKEPDPEAADSNGSKAGLDHNFCMKLHYLLENSHDQSHVISWQPHGRCFMVHDMKEFVSSMLPLWFRQSKFASFQRQLNLYGFQRLTQGKWAWFCDVDVIYLSCK
jgi:HSF-type DNA-binding